MPFMFATLFLFLLFVAVWDCIKFKIPNLFILIGFILFPSLLLWHEGWIAAGKGLLSFMICSLILYAIWKGFKHLNLPLIGGGDYKLFMVISMVVGIGHTFTIFYYSLIIGGLSFVFLLPPRTTIRMVSDFFSYLFYGIPFLPETKLKKIPYAVPIALTTYLVLCHPNFFPFTF